MIRSRRHWRKPEISNFIRDIYKRELAGFKAQALQIESGSAEPHPLSISDDNLLLQF